MPDNERPVAIPPDTQAILESIRQDWRKSMPPEALARVCRKYGLSLLILFGSHVKGRAHPNSDVDVAVLPVKHRRPDLLRLYADLVPVLGSDRLDIINLRHAPPLLAWNVAREGILLYAENEWEWFRYRLRAIQEWDDSRKVVNFWLMEVDRSLREWEIRK